MADDRAARRGWRWPAWSSRATCASRALLRRLHPRRGAGSRCGGSGRGRLVAPGAARDLDLGRSSPLAGRHGLRFVVPGDDEWPGGPGTTSTAASRCRRSGGAPLGLWVRGPRRPGRRWPATPSAIVGSRASTAYGERVATDLAAGLAGPRHHGRLGRRVRHRRRGPPGRARRRRADGRGAGRRPGRLLPARQRGAARGRWPTPACWWASATGRAPDPAALPDPEPADRGAVGRHGHRRGQRAQRGAQHRHLGDVAAAGW